MDREQFLEWLRIYRHDLMNDLQIVQGYASMGKHDKSTEKVNALIERLKQERLLQTLNCDAFVYWLLSTSLTEHDLNLTFSVDTPLTDVSALDELLTHDGQMIVEQLEAVVNEWTDVSMHVSIEGENALSIHYDLDLPKNDQQSLLNKVCFQGVWEHTEQHDHNLLLTIQYKESD
ncbi:stage 0 sporulation protein B (sporulation initiation phosphotransferase) [Alkalibacillus flavidus]|uniref:Stage 0 sporulation protein B (Sporulation initiation phosphotransferase) n=2 Tax=Alkalibacillus flavidus TaxID=546021 RepID=A0ABV2KSJ7_9BACI